MIAGPNGSGKSTLLNSLQQRYSLPLGYRLNPDEIEGEFWQSRRIYLGWHTHLDDAVLHAFIRGHYLGRGLKGRLPTMDGNTLIAHRGFRCPYFAVILGDLFRLQWLASKESFTFETVMSHPGEL
jgi:hypothetical protein